MEFCFLMLYRGMTKSQIEEILSNKGDFVKIDLLTKFLREEMSLDTKKFVYIRLAEIYEKLKMFNNSAKMFENAAIVSVAFTEKINFHLKEAESYIKTNHFEKVDSAIKKAMEHANASQKAEIIFHIKRFYLREAQAYETEVKRNQASKIYEKLLTMRLSHQEEKEVKEKLINLYQKLGKFKEVEFMKKTLNGFS